MGDSGQPASFTLNYQTTCNHCGETLYPGERVHGRKIAGTWQIVRPGHPWDKNSKKIWTPKARKKRVWAMVGESGQGGAPNRNGKSYRQPKGWDGSGTYRPWK